MAWVKALLDESVRHAAPWLAAALVTLPARPGCAQEPPAVNGLKGDYYNGVNFDEFVVSRRDASIAFEWAQRPPAPGVAAQYFSVRWTGWLVPPTSGRYVFHATIDDGMRIWLNGHLILNEWRPQRVWTFTTAVDLKAGESYALRVEYFQDILDTRAQLTWERPDAPKELPPASWRNLWGLNAEVPTPKPIPTQFLFARNPRPAPPIIVPLRSVPLRDVFVKATAAPPPKRAASHVRQAGRVPTITVVQSAPISAPAAATAPSLLPFSALSVTDSSRTALLSRLAVGEAVTLPELYFDQGQARLLSTARSALDGLAAALHAQPALRIEVQGHTDNVGNAALNLQLSQQRAETVCLYLTAHGVAAGQLRPVGYGGTRPVADNADPAQRPRNRRVVLERR